MNISKLSWIIGILLMMGSLLMTNSCRESAEKNYKLRSTSQILVTSERGDKMASKENIPFTKGQAAGTIIHINPEGVKQTMDGIGTSLTEASAYVLAHLDRDKRRDVMQNIFGQDGANFSLTRTHIGACDFCVEGKYSYADKKDDVQLEHFTLAPDKEGFDPDVHPGIVDAEYDLLPMIKEALDIKNNQDDKVLKIVSSAWTAPAWMKDIEEWYIPMSAQNNWQGTGGQLKEEYRSTYADYLVKYLEAYKEEGVPVWAITPVNEPHGNSGQWESMHFTPASQNEFIKHYLGPKLKSSQHANTKLFIYDQNRDGLEAWTDEIFADPQTAPFVYGAAVHWYESTVKVYEEVFDRVHDKFPDFALIHTEGCIDDLGKPAPAGIADPERFQESNWFNNDAFWWNVNATDWAYTAPWAGDNVEDHPAYTPVHRYARNIIVSIDHWLQGWIDWNIVLDHNGGPNHVGNFCGAPIMIDTQSKQIYYTPIFHVLSQLSRTIRPGDKAVQTEKQLVDLDEDAMHACATLSPDKVLSVQVLNTTKSPIEYAVQIGRQNAKLTIPENTVQTVRIEL